MSESKLLTTSEVAEKLSVSRRRVSAMVQANRIKAEKYGPIFLVREKDLQPVMVRPVGRPSKK